MDARCPTPRPVFARRPRRVRRTIGSLAGLALTVLPGCTLVGYPAGGSPSSARPVIVPAGATSVPGAGVEPGDQPRPAGSASAGTVEDPATFVIPAGARLPDHGRTYEVFGQEYRVVDDATGWEEEGEASWYGPEFHGRPTASGERFDQYGLSAAHRTLPLHTFVEVTNLLTGEALVVRINDRGPFAHTDRRILDLSYGAALRLSLIGPGTAPVRLRVVEPG